MELVKFLQECSLKEFTDWMKDACISNSFKNIENGTPFKVIIINDIDLDGEYSYYNTGAMDDIESFYNLMKSYSSNYIKEQNLFDLNETTRIFTYSNSDELLNCKSEELYPLISVLQEEDPYPYKTHISSAKCGERFIRIVNNMQLRYLPKAKIFYNDDNYTIGFDRYDRTTEFLYELIDILENDEMYENLVKGKDNYPIENNSLYTIIKQSIVLKDSNFGYYNNSKNEDNKKFYVIPVLAYETIPNILSKKHDPFYILDDIYILFADQMYTIEELIDVLKYALDKNNELFYAFYDYWSCLGFILVDSKEDLDKILHYKDTPSVLYSILERRKEASE